MPASAAPGCSNSIARTARKRTLFYYDNMTFALNYTLSLRQVKADAVFWPVPVMENQFGERRNYFYSKHWLTSGFIVSAAKLRWPRSVGQ